jgi:deferrochelatase/peroxidase EfeB
MGISTRTAGAIGALLLSAAFASDAQAQMQFQCQQYATRRQRTECYQRQAATAPGPSCLFFCPPAPQPAKRTTHRRAKIY